jgi:arabinogalactan oligomer/maltooligosaccharide transport system substrate-binding protein
LTKDTEAAADIFALVDDNLTELVKTNNILEIGGEFKTRATANNVAWTVDAATRNGKLYGFPQTADNTYFMWYNADYVSEVQAEKLETVLAAAQTAGKGFIYDISNSWYTTSLFTTNGGTLSVTSSEDGDIQNCNFNTAGPVATAEAAFALKGLYGATWSKEDAIVSGMTAEVPTMVGGVGGSWQYADLLAGLGAKLRATKLPTINVGGTDHQLGGFRSAKLVSIKANTAYPNEALAFAEFATNFASQELRFTERGVGPSNIQAAALDAVENHLMLSAINEQSQYGVNQATSVTGGYWGPTGAVGGMIFDQDWGEYVTAQAALDAAVAQMNATA